MSKVKVKDVVGKIITKVEEDKFSEADKLVEAVIAGKIRNKIENTKKKLFPK